MPKRDDFQDKELIKARAALSTSSIYVLRKLWVERDGNELVLRGDVDSFYHKQLAQELVRTAVNSLVVNAVQVNSDPEPDYTYEGGVPLPRKTRSRPLEGNAPAASPAQRSTSPLDIYIDPGDASIQEVRDVLSALNALHLAAGGQGFEFQIDGEYVRALQEVPT
jgi:hypothetical protein